VPAALAPPRPDAPASRRLDDVVHPHHEHAVAIEPEASIAQMTQMRDVQLRHAQQRQTDMTAEALREFFIELRR
jgi:hypothetical protein